MRVPDHLGNCFKVSVILATYETTVLLLVPTTMILPYYSGLAVQSSADDIRRVGGKHWVSILSWPGRCWYLTPGTTDMLCITNSIPGLHRCGCCYSGFSAGLWIRSATAIRSVRVCAWHKNRPGSHSSGDTSTFWGALDEDRFAWRDFEKGKVFDLKEDVVLACNRRLVNKQL